MPEEQQRPHVDPDPQAVAAPPRVTPEAPRHRPLLYEAGPTTIPLLRFGGELPLSLTYTVQQPTPRGWRKQPAEITLRAELLGTGVQLATSYTVPPDFKVRDELPAVEQALYDFIGEVIRAEEQRRRATAAEAQVNTLEDLTAHPDMRAPFADAGLLGRDAAPGVAPETIRELIATVTSLTRVTSLSYDAFLAAQGRDVNQLAQLLDGDARKTSAALLTNLVGLMEHKIRSGMSTRELQLFVLAHLERVNDATRLLSAADAEQILERLVPAVLRYHEAQRRLPKFPGNLVEHIGRGAILGYVIAWLGNKFLGAATLTHLSTLGQGYVNHAFGTRWQYPAFPVVWVACGAVICCWPYLHFPYAYLVARIKMARLHRDMLRTVQLTLHPADRNGADLARYAEAFRSQPGGEREK